MEGRISNTFAFKKTDFALSSGVYCSHNFWHFVLMTKTTVRSEHKGISKKTFSMSPNVINFHCASGVKGYFIQIKVLRHHERAPLCCPVLYWNVSVFGSTEIHRLSSKAGGKLKSLKIKPWTTMLFSSGFQICKKLLPAVLLNHMKHV